MKVKSKTRFIRTAWGVLGYNLLVILWGAYVRATGSGAGCGAHWPTCQGEVIPRSPSVETMVEFTHRLMSGTTLILMVVLAVWAWQLYERGHIVRKAAALALLFTITEALVGAGLVLFELVAENDSAARAISVTIHLVNTFLLLAMTALTAWWASYKNLPEFHISAKRGGAWFALAWFGVMVLGATGAVTALGDTLFPAGSLAEGLRQDLSPTAHFLIRLRVYHPVIAVLMTVFSGLLVYKIRLGEKNPQSRKLAYLLIGLFVLQLGLGGLNVVLLAPVWMQMVHLLVADGIWITLVLWTASTFSALPSFEAVPAKTDAQQEGTVNRSVTLG